MPAVYEHPHVVRYDESDELGLASNVAYVTWMLDAALAHTAAQGWPAEAYRTLGAGWVVRRHEIEYLQPALPGQELVVRTWVATMEKVSSLRRYEIRRRADGALLAAAATRWAFIDYTRRKPRRIPPQVARAFEVVPD